jgi:hypothetical protein
VTADIDTLCAEISEMHRDLYHPGFECAENERAECLDRFGGTPARWPLGVRWPVGRNPFGFTP